MSSNLIIDHDKSHSNEKKEKKDKKDKSKDKKKKDKMVIKTNVFAITPRIFEQL